MPKSHIPYSLHVVCRQYSDKFGSQSDISEKPELDQKE